MVANCTQTGPVIIRKNLASKSRSERYIPDVLRANIKLGLTVDVDLKEAIRRTFRHGVVQCNKNLKSSLPMLSGEKEAL
jgi:hypothetical protein